MASSELFYLFVKFLVAQFGTIVCYATYFFYIATVCNYPLFFHSIDLGCYEGVGCYETGVRVGVVS